MSILENEYAIKREWVKFDDFDSVVPCTSDKGPDCKGLSLHLNNMPQIADNVGVPNPKDAVSEAGKGFNIVKEQIYATYGDMLPSQWGGDYAHALDAMSVPVPILDEAVQTMKKLKEKAEDIGKEEKKNYILNVLGIIFALLPFIGEILGPLAPGLALIGRIATVIGEVGDKTLDIYSIEQDPSSAPLVIVGSLMGTVGFPFSRSGPGTKGLEEVKSTIDANNMMKKIGSVAKANDNLVKRPIGACKK